MSDVPEDGRELPQQFAEIEPGTAEPTTVEDGQRLGDSLLEPPLGPPSGFDRSPVGCRRRLAGLAPAMILLPLALVSLGIYLLKPAWLQQTEPTAQTQRTEASVATAAPSPSSTATEVAAPTPALLSTTEADAYLAEAQSLSWQSRFEEAIEIYEALVQQAPDDARPEIGWAMALLLDGLPDQALSHARSAVALDPTHAQAATVLARAYVGVGDKRSGLSAAQMAVGLDARSAEAHAALAEAYLLNDQLQEAVEEANLALNLDRRSAEARRVRGRLYDRVDNNLQGAVREFRSAADLQPRLWLRHYDLGMALLRAEENQAAIVALTEAWVLRRKLLTYNALGQAYYRLGEYDRAASYLEQSLAAGVWNADTYALLADIDARQGRCTDARIYAQNALTQDPNHPVALAARDRCLEASPAQEVTATAPSISQEQAGVPTSPPPLTGQLAFPIWNVQTSEYDTYVANVDGGERRLVVEGMHQPAFSPNGQWLAVNGERPDHLNLCIVRPDGSGLQEITEHVEDSLPCWSPGPLEGGTEGLALAFSSTRHGDRQSRIYILDRALSGGQKDRARSLNGGTDDVRGEYPAWVEDADQAYLVYSGCTYYDGGSAQCGLMLMPTALGPQTTRALTAYPEDTAPAAHGSQIAFMSNRDGNWEIYRINSDGSGLKRLTHNTASDGLPTWSPDGRAIAFVSDQGGVWAFWVVNPDGSGRRKLFDMGDPGLGHDWQQERIDWGP